MKVTVLLVVRTVISDLDPSINVSPGGGYIHGTGRSRLWPPPLITSNGRAGPALHQPAPHPASESGF